MRPLRLLAPSTFVVLSLAASAATAQQPPPGPPPGFEQQYGQPQPGQPPPPVYQLPPAPPPGVPMGPKTMEYEDGDPVPPGYHVDTRIRKGLVIAGAVTFGAFYIITALSGAFAQALSDVCIGDGCSGDGGDEFTPMYIPVAGPFITMGTAHASGAGIFALAVLGVVQAGGVAMFVTGLAAPKTELVRNDIGKPSVHVLPALDKNSVGLTLVGAM